MLYYITKTIVKAPFYLIGFDLVRRKPPAPNSDPDLPPLFDNPLEALCYEQGGKSAAFHCPISATVMQNGLSYSRNGWHPFVATLREYAAGNARSYKTSALRKFYETHQPSHAAEAIVGFDQMPGTYATYPPHLYRLAPWQSRNAEEADHSVRKWTQRHGREHGNSEQKWSFDADGFQYHGPVSTRKGELEYRRLVSIYETLRADRYRRLFGHAHFVVLKRGGEYRFLNSGGGSHRTAAMSALGHSTIPARFRRRHAVDVARVAYWPQVQNGLWTIGEAEAYFHHLFDFDSLVWGREHGLLRGRQGIKAEENMN